MSNVHLYFILKMSTLEAGIELMLTNDLAKAELRPCVRPLATRSRTSSCVWRIGPKKTAMPRSASSTAIPARKKAPHETPDHRPARRRSLCRYQIPDGIFLVAVQRVKFCRHKQKPYYALPLTILEPSSFAGHVISSTLFAARRLSGS